jgi:hypothetical protein
VREYIATLGAVTPLSASTANEKHMQTRIFVNGAWIGTIRNENSLETLKKLKYAKRSGRIHIQTGIIWRPSLREIWITTEAGRMLRPLFYAAAIRDILRDTAVLNEVNALKNWEAVLLWESPNKNHLIEYIDPGETESTYIATYPHEVHIVWIIAKVFGK